MITSITLDDKDGNAVVLHETTGRVVTHATGLLGGGVAPPRDNRRVRPQAHGGIDDTKYTDGRIVTLDCEAFSNASLHDAFAQYRAMCKPMQQTLDYGPAWLKWQEDTPTIPAVPPTPAYSPAVLADSPALYWRLGEASGATATDSSGNGRTGTYGAGVTLGATGALSTDTDKAASFNNTTTATVVSSYNPFVAGSSRTFEAWVNRSSTADFDTIFSGTDPTHRPGFDCPIPGTDLEFFPDLATYPSGGATWTSVLPNGAYAHVVLTWNDSTKTAELFINGVSKGTRTTTASFNASPGNFQVSRGDFNFWNGSIDEVAVYPTILSSARILAHYNAASQTTGGSPGVDGGLALQRLVKIMGEVDPPLAEAAAMLDFTAQFFSEDPRAYSQTLTTDSSTALSSSGGGMLMPFTFPFVFTSSGGGTVTATNAGEKKSPPVFRIYGYAQNPQIVNLGTGDRIVINGAVANGQYLEIDTQARTVKLSDGTNLRNLLTSSLTSWFELPSGATNLQMIATAFDSSARLDVLHRDAY